MPLHAFVICAISSALKHLNASPRRVLGGCTDRSAYASANLGV
jgi:hypothetical protein